MKEENKLYTFYMEPDLRLETFPLICGGLGERNRRHAIATVGLGLIKLPHHRKRSPNVGRTG